LGEYQLIATQVASEILSGALRPGERLPPQRTFAYERGIAVSTASRVYSELRARGLVVGEVGRGTFVRYGHSSSVLAANEPSRAPIDLQFATSVLPEQASWMGPGYESFFSQGVLTSALQAIAPEGTLAMRNAIAGMLATDDWRPDPRRLLMVGNGRQAAAAAIMAVCRAGDRLGVEPLTYPVIKSFALRYGLQLVPLKSDDQGVQPEALAEAHATEPLTAVYLQPTLQNPLGFTMGQARRTQIAAVLETQKLLCIEDGIATFLKDCVPLAALAPERVIYIDSLSKRLAPGVGLGLILTPPSLTDRVANTVRAANLVPSSVAAALGLRWIVDGTVAQVKTLKRKDAVIRQSIVRDMLTGHELVGDPCSYHVWLSLPERWRADAFVVAAAQRGVAISPGRDFATLPAHAPNAVRVAITMPPLPELQRGIETLLGLLDSDPRSSVFEWEAS
jgi:DNA-binding transcriptional MocR family regulator